MSKAPKYKLEDTFVNFKNEDNKEVFNKWRAFNGSNFKSLRTKFRD